MKPVEGPTEQQNQVRRLMGERDLLLSAIAPADYAKIQARIVAISESPDAPVEGPRETKEKTMDLQAKYDKAMDLLSRAENRMDAEVPDANWLEEYYGLTGDHMILTEEGWTPGDNKPEIRPEDILMEVNVPDA